MATFMRFYVPRVCAFPPLLNRGELAVLYCFVFLFIAARGPGSVSTMELRRSGCAPRHRLNKHRFKLVFS